MARASARDRVRGINRVPGGAELRAWNGISRVLRAKGNMPNAHDARRTAPADSQFEPKRGSGSIGPESDLSSPASPRMIAAIAAMRATLRRNAGRSVASRVGSAILDRDARARYRDGAPAFRPHQSRHAMRIASWKRAP